MGAGCSVDSWRPVAGLQPLLATRHLEVMCSATLISLMAGECRVGTEVDVTNQPRSVALQPKAFCRLAAELAHNIWCSRRESNPEPWD